jgi:hypothetical protein
MVLNQYSELIHKLEFDSKMIDPRFTDPEQLQRIHQQKSEAMKVLMSEIIDNPGGVKVDELKKVIDFLDKQPTINDENDGRSTPIT